MGWRQSRFICLILALVNLSWAQAAFAQVNNLAHDGEAIQIIVTTDTITIETNFTGTHLYIAGVLENADPLLLRQNGYDIVIAISGSPRQYVMREKQRKIGMWVNADAINFYNVPTYYAVASTRELRDIAPEEAFKKIGLGVDFLPLRSDSTNPEKNERFRKELIEIKSAQHLYSETVGTVTFGSSSLFTAKFQLPANVPVGSYQVSAFLFKERDFIANASTELSIVKSHTAYSIFRSAHVHSVWYGLIAVFVAVATGFVGRFIFRKD